MINTDSKEAFLLKRIEASQAGSGCSVRVGDLSGDGRLDFVLVQPDNISDERYFSHSVSAATAYTADGELLWQLGTPSYEEVYCGADVPAQIYDIDRDGYNEFLCVYDGFFCIFDGRSGELKRKFPLPDPEAHDCFIIANLDGSGYPQNIIIKNRYHRLWALDKNFNVLWTYKGNIGHFPIACDLNGDGRDEIIAGTAVLDADGNIMWEFDRTDFPKSVCVGDLDMNGEYSIIAGGDKTEAYTPSGDIKWTLRSGTQTSALSLGNIRTDIFGSELTGYFKEPPGSEYTDGIFTVDYHGNTVFKEKRTEYAGFSNIAAVYNFDGNGSEYLLSASKSDNILCLYDGYMNPIYKIPANGKVIAADIMADGISQIVVYDGQSINIYADKERDLTKSFSKEPRPQKRSLCNATDYPYYLQDLSRNAIGYAIGQFAKPDIKVWAAQCALEDSDEVMTRADFCILLVSILNISGYTTDLFFDVSANDYFAPAIAALKSSGYIDDIVGKFAPSSPLTAEFAAKLITQSAGIAPITTKSGEEELTKKDAAKLILQIIQSIEEK